MNVSNTEERMLHIDRNTGIAVGCHKQAMTQREGTSRRGEAKGRKGSGIDDTAKTG